MHQYEYQDIITKVNDQTDLHLYAIDPDTNVLPILPIPYRHSTTIDNFLIGPLYDDNHSDFRFFLNVTRHPSAPHFDTAQIICQDVDDNAFLNSTAEGLPANLPSIVYYNR